MNPIQVESIGVTDRGLVRAENQDHFLIAELNRAMRLQSTSLPLSPESILAGGTLGYLFMVADGMGGHRAGNEASGLAIQYFITSILNRIRWHNPVKSGDEVLLVDDLREMLSQAHDEIVRQSETTASLAGMGTTLTMAYVVWPRMVVVHAGDTRCYLMRDGELRLLTRDHTVAEQLLQAGKLDPNAVERSRWSNVLVNALGANAEDVYAEVVRLDLEPNDKILLCSDGLNKHVQDETIQSVLAEATSMQQAATTLIQLANEGGGSDNITLIAARWTANPTGRIMRVTASIATEHRVFSELHPPTPIASDDPTSTTVEVTRASTCDFGPRSTDPPPE
jgi:serine/threonine protein phosphatase PrpC